MPGDKCRFDAAFPNRREGRDRGRQDRGLSDLCSLQLFRRPFEASAGKRKSQCIVGRIENGPCRWVSLGDFEAHAGRLGALPGEQESGRRHLQAARL